MNIVGSKVRTIREGKNLTQEQLVAHCNLIGWSISRGTLAKIESRVRCVTDKEVLLLSTALKVNVNQLYDGLLVKDSLIDRQDES
ncbi:MAG: helix-turn-helix transcriptional regulator [Thiotrichales bacterium]|jgi:transcriptional regulator with XRE-family HTH domain|nr:helix-turn-helix transcriptional regulator [Thiotrichales bacterium]